MHLRGFLSGVLACCGVVYYRVIKNCEVDRITEKSYYFLYL